MMKFPRPKHLVENIYPDCTLNQPDIFKALIQKVIRPSKNSPMDKYIQSTIDYLKKAKQLA